MNSPDADKKPLIELRGVSLVRDDKMILSDVNITINKGDFVLVTGPNGGGKTSLLRLILNLITPSSGKISFHGNTRTNSKDHSIGYLPQKNSVDAQFPITVREVIASALLNSSLDKDEKVRRINHALELIELKSHKGSPIGRLSGGQLQRTLLARAIVSQPKILILDEPLSYLDVHFEERFFQIMKDIAPHTTIIMVSHQQSAVNSLATRRFYVDHTVSEK